MQSVLISVCFICKVYILCSALYAKCMCIATQEACLVAGREHALHHHGQVPRMVNTGGDPSIIQGIPPKIPTIHVF